jgi:hypothetical protein
MTNSPPPIQDLPAGRRYNILFWMTVAGFPTSAMAHLVDDLPWWTSAQERRREDLERLRQFVD